jgi:hypothetical protein
VKTKQILQAVDCKTAWQPLQQRKKTSLEAAAEASEASMISWTESRQQTSVPFNLASESVNISYHQIIIK